MAGPAGRPDGGYPPGAGGGGSPPPGGGGGWAGVVAGMGASFATFRAAEAAALPRLVGNDQLSRAVLLNQARGYSAGLLGPPLGGLLFSLGQAVPFLTNAAGYLFSLLTIRGIRAR